ncbi:MAG: AAA family ATPase [Acidobacteriota bacterium]
MLKLPYGLADFSRLIRDGYVYIDRTQHLRAIEELGGNLLFIRPRRFGKSLWLRTLAAYYDLRTEGEHDELFGELAVGRDPTPDAHRYFILSWDFSAVSPRGSVSEVAQALNDYVNTTIEGFASDYRDVLPPVSIRDDATNTLQLLLAAIRRAGHPLYLLIDEYDNFANEVMVRDEGTYSRLVHGDGPFKELMKTVKAATQGQGLERLFVTGVSPMVMSDLSSGMNILADIYQSPELNELCGFRDDEILDLVERIHAASAASGSAPSWTIEEARQTIRRWYNGYSFSPLASGKIYNPTMALYFLDHLQRYGSSPRQLLDANLAADEDKLHFVAEIVAGRQSLLDRLQDEAPLEVPALAGRFKLSDIVERSGDQTFLASFLTYFGMLTIEGESPGGALRLVPPNLVVRKLYVEQVKRLLLPKSADRNAAWPAAQAAIEQGDIAPLLTFVEERIFPAMSNRDYRWMDEHALKMAFLTLLFNDVTHLVVSELELGRGYADLCLLRRFDRRLEALYDLVFEFKYLPLVALGITGEELRAMDREGLEKLTPVREALAAARQQLRRYREALEERYDGLHLRAHTVVSLGFERLVAQELP